MFLILVLGYKGDMPPCRLNRPQLPGLCSIPYRQICIITGSQVLEFAAWRRYGGINQPVSVDHWQGEKHSGFWANGFGCVDPRLWVGHTTMSNFRWRGVPSHVLAPIWPLLTSQTGCWCQPGGSQLSGLPSPIKPSDGLVNYMQAESDYVKKRRSLPAGEESHRDINKPAGTASNGFPLYRGGKIN